MTASAGATITAIFSTRRQADLAIEQLVQELEIDRSESLSRPRATKTAQAKKRMAPMRRAAIRASILKEIRLWLAALTYRSISLTKRMSPP